MSRLEFHHMQVLTQELIDFMAERGFEVRHQSPNTPIESLTFKDEDDFLIGVQILDMREDGDKGL
jgi:hypothetical protein